MICLYIYLFQDYGFLENTPLDPYVWAPYGYSLMLQDWMNEFKSQCFNDAKTPEAFRDLSKYTAWIWVGLGIDSGASHSFLFLRRSDHDSLFH